MKCAILRSCLENTTAHGVVYTVSGRTYFQRILWVVLIAAASAVFLYCLSKNVMKYNAEPISVSMDTKSVSFEPPDLHLCNVHAFGALRIHENTSESSWLDAVNKINKLVDHHHHSEGEDMNHLFFSNINHSLFYSQIGHLHNRTIFHFEGANTTKKLHPEVTSNIQYFSCFRIALSKVMPNMSPSDVIHLYLFMDLDNKDEKDDQHKIHDIPLTQLSYYLPFPKLLGPQGLVIVFTPPSGYPHEDSHSVLVKPNGHTMIKLKMQKTESVSTKSRPCLKERKYIRYYNPILGGDSTTEYKKGFADCKYRKALETLWKDHSDCQCIPYMVPMTLNDRKYHYCTDISRPNHEKEYSCFKILSDIFMQLMSSECHAEEPCNTTAYSTETWTSQWPTGDTGKAIKKQMIKIIKETKDEHLMEIIEETDDLTSLDNFAVVSVAPAEVKCLLIKEAISYDWENLISDTGGIAGLCIGVSMLTVMELFNILHDMIYTAMLKKKERPTIVLTPLSQI